jgi:hypothetical protein
MAEHITPEAQIAPEPELTKRFVDPKGVLQKNMKLALYLGAALLVILAAVFSSSGKKTPGSAPAAKNQPPQPAVQDNTDNNVAELKSQLQAEQLQEQQAAAAAYGPTGQPLPCVPGQTCPQAYSRQSTGQPQLTPGQQQAQQLAAKERELAYNSRFASNLAYARSTEAPAASQQTAVTMNAPTGYVQNPYVDAAALSGSSLIAPRNAGAQTTLAPTGQASLPHGPEVNIDSAVGQAYVIYEGTTLDTVLMNRLDGDAVGPVKVLVSNPVYLQQQVYGGDGLADIFEWPLTFGLLALLVQLLFSIPKDIRRKEMKYGRRLKGPIMVTPKEFNRTFQGTGIGIQTDGCRPMLRIPIHAEDQHVEIVGDTGSGKTTIIMQMLQQIEARGDSAIVYDQACEFIERFYDAGRGDIVLNPLDRRCPYWRPSEELVRRA